MRANVLALGLASLALAPAAAGATCVPASHQTVAYRTVPGVARDLTSLDLYVPPRRCRRKAAVPPTRSACADVGKVRQSLS